MALLKEGLHPDASAALAQVGITTARISQTIGKAKASAGTHLADGSAGGHEYCAATDLRVHDLSEAQVQTLLVKLGNAGLAAWYRNPGHDHWPAADVLHVHAVYAGCPMKHSLRDQIHDFCHGRNGLASHAAYAFATRPDSAVNKVRALFLAHNQAVGITGGPYVYDEQGKTDEDSHAETNLENTEPINDGLADLLSAAH